MALIVVFENITKLAPVSDYRVKVGIGDGTVAGTHRIYEGTIKNHKREDGWQALVRRLVDEREWKKPHFME